MNGEAGRVAEEVGEGKEPGGGGEAAALDSRSPLHVRFPPNLSVTAAAAM